MAPNLLADLQNHLSVLVASLIGASAGLLGSLLSGHWSRRHEDKTRFHERKLTAYAEYLSALSLMSGAISNGSQDYDAQLKEIAKSVSINWHMVHLLGSEKVLQSLDKIFVLDDLLDAIGNENQAAMLKLLDDGINSVTMEMREDLEA